MYPSYPSKIFSSWKPISNISCWNFIFLPEICMCNPLGAKKLTFWQNNSHTIECLRKRNSQIRFHKKYVGTKKYCGIPQIKVKNSTIFSNFVERLHKLSPTTFFLDRSSILWKIDPALASPLPLRIPQIKSGLFLWNLALKIPHSQTLYWARVLSSYKNDNNYNDCKYTLGFSDSVPTMLAPPYILRQLPMSIIKLGLWWPNRPYRPRPDGPGRPRPEPDVCSALPDLVVKS